MFLNAIGALAQSVGGGLMNAAMSAADKVLNPGETISSAVGGSRAARALQDPAKFFDDEMAEIARKLESGEPLDANQMAALQGFQQKAQQDFQNAQAAVQIPTGGFMNSAQQRLL